MIEINGKLYRNLQEQVKKNMEDIEDLQEGIVTDVYTKTETDSKFLSKTQANTNFVSKANLTDYSIDGIIVGNSEVDVNNVDLRAVYSQDVKSEVSLEPTSAIIKTTSGTNNSTIGLSGTEVDITTGTLKYNGNEVVNIDSDNNLNKTIIRVNQIGARDGEETDCKGNITFGSGVRTGNVQITAGGEESDASILVRGTSSTDSEGLIELHGETKVYTGNRIEVIDGVNTEQVAYLSDITGGSSYTAGNGINIDSNNEITAKLGDNLTFDNRGRITTGSNVLVTDSDGNLNQPLTTGNSNGYSIRNTTSYGTTISKFSAESLSVSKYEYSGTYGTNNIDFYLTQFLAQYYPTINIVAGQPGQTAITHINIPHNPTAGTTVTYTLATTADLQALIDRIAALEQALQNNNN